MAAKPMAWARYGRHPRNPHRAGQADRWPPLDFVSALVQDELQRR
jgi:hypothetical protein